ncbi:MAG: DUF924 family protein [Pseudomonadota bacterium]
MHGAGEARRCADADREAIEAVLAFWLEEVGPDDWFTSDPALDDRCRNHCGALAEAAAEGRLQGWQSSARGALALLILLDQMPRNIHRGTANAFATDPLARRVAKRSLALGYDLAFESPVRNLFYLPLMHSESVANQHRYVRLSLLRFGQHDPETGERTGPMTPDEEDAFRYGIAHRETIRRFGRFPARNDALGRRSTAAESAFLATGAHFVMPD